MYCSARCRERGRNDVKAERARLGVCRAGLSLDLARDERLPVPEGVLLLTHAVYDQAIKDRDEDWLRNLSAQGLWWTVLREVTG